MAAAGAVAALAMTGVVAQPALADDADVLAVDFSARTGDFRGGATGTLYGFGDEGAPTQALINGAAITNTSQKAPYGTQHPSGDAIKVEDGFFAKHGEDMYIYVQDYYPDWSYNGGRRPGDARTYNQADGTYTNTPNGVWDYLEVVEFVAEAVATDSARPQDYVFITFNEPDGGNWYPNWSTQKTQFLDDWQATFDKVQEVWARHGLGHARIGGPGDTRWQPERSRDILEFAKANGSLPDVFIWHELGIDNLAQYRQNFANYRALEASLGIDPIHVNITEYGMLRDMGVPGQLIQWFAMFEDTKVDAQTAYWNYAGNFSDNSARPNGANAGWWMFKWYGDLNGAETAQVTPPTPNGVDTLQGIAAVDDENRRATVLWGGTDRDVSLDLSGLDPAVFGDAVDIEVREAALTGAEGLADTPRVVAAIDGAALDAGSLDLVVPTYDRYAGYQLIITPSQHRDVSAAQAAQPWTASIEAENMQLTAAQAYTQDPKAGGGWKFLASGGRDVGSFNRATSKADWTLDVPHDGTYRLQVVGGAPGVPGRHALFVDGTAAGTIQYTADLALNATSRWQYRGSAELLVDLTAGTHTLSVRASADGTNRLPNSDITLDKVSLTSVGEGEPTSYPASGFRLTGEATLEWDGEQAGSAALLGDGRADVYASAFETGYYDLVVDWATADAAELALDVNGQSTPAIAVDQAGAWRSTTRAHLVEGVNEIELRSPAGASVSNLTTVRARDADDAAVSIEAESARLVDGAAVQTLADSTGTNASGRAFAGWVGNGAGAIVIDRAAGFDTAGGYDLTVHYSNAETSGDHAYNPQVVDRRIDVSEGGEHVGDAYFRYTYSWNSFWQRTIPVTLSTADQPLRFGNTTGWAPNVDRIVIAPRTLGEPTTESTLPPAEVPAAPAAPTATAASDTSIAVAWAAPEHDGGSAITGYRVVDTASGEVVCEVGAATLDCRVDELALGSSHAYAVVALNTVGESPASAASAVVTLPEVPTDDGAKAVPAKGVLSSDNGWDTGLLDGAFRITMNLWWGENASLFKLYENGTLVSTTSLTTASPKAQTATVDISGLGNGVYQYVGVLVNSKGQTSTAPLTVQVRDAKPGIPVLSHDNWDKDGDYTVSADLWWGTNATSYRLLENGVPIADGALVARSPGAQHASVEVHGQAKGSYEYVIEFANSAGTTSSVAKTVTVK
ncbi:fibronectin type III domain-containing protein [Agromyces allii]|uniref:Fibronectin type III domain-containing protein n=2 Tax=Agromyces allii TaxID=393607 RepID=A0ABN2QZ49_9MICO|nr:fibronectin type III domain-containing protein [Agromyces allii]